MTTTTMKLRHALAATVLLACAGLPAFAAQAGAPARAQELRAMCSHCALVDEVRSEERKGKGSGLGVVGGAVVGGLLGNQVGGGTGKALMTAGGAVAGGVAGNEIEKRAKKYTVWITRVTMKDGSTRSFENTSAPAWRKGDVVQVEGKHLVRK